MLNRTVFHLSWDSAPLWSTLSQIHFRGPREDGRDVGAIPLTLLGTQGGRCCWTEQRCLCSAAASQGPNNQASVGEVLKSFCCKGAFEDHQDPTLELFLCLSSTHFLWVLCFTGEPTPEAGEASGYFTCWRMTVCQHSYRSTGCCVLQQLHPVTVSRTLGG